MIYFLDQLKADLKAQVQKQFGVDEALIQVERANPKTGADLAIPVFQIAKSLKGRPDEVANQLTDELKNLAINRVEAIGGFVNIWLRPEQLAAGLINDLKSTPKYGEHESNKDKTAVVDFIGPNLAKPFSVGHLRPTNIGWAVIQLLKATGFTVIGDSHIGDWGTPFGKWVVGFKRYSSEEQLEKDGVYELARIYIKVTEDLRDEDDPKESELYQEVRLWLKKLESGDAEAKSYHERFMKISLDHTHRVLDRLKVKPDEELGESFYIDKAKQMVETMVSSGVATRQDDGSVIVPLDKHGIEVPALLEKRDGTSLYLTTDIATIDYRVAEWNPALIVYVVAAEQQFHFQQLFALAKELNYTVNMVHAWFGLIEEIGDDGKRRKMSSRSGTVYLEQLLDKAEKTAQERFPESSSSAEDTSKIAMGAVKFNDFAQRRQMNILFDWERMFSLHGFSGPYVQYAAVRIKSILSKEGDVPELKADENYDWEAEKNLLWYLAHYPQVVAEAAAEYEPHTIASFLYDLARELNRYYENTPVNNAEGEVKVLRRGLLKATYGVFAHGLGLLGIELPEKM